MWGQLRVWSSAVELRCRDKPAVGQYYAATWYLHWVEPKPASGADRQASVEENRRTGVWLCVWAPTLLVFASKRCERPQCSLHLTNHSLLLDMLNLLWPGLCLCIPCPQESKALTYECGKECEMLDWSFFFWRATKVFLLLKDGSNSVHLCGRNFRTQIGVYGCLTWHKWTELTACLEAFDFPMHPGQNSIYVLPSCRCSQSV